MKEKPLEAENVFFLPDNLVTAINEFVDEVPEDTKVKAKLIQDISREYKDCKSPQEALSQFFESWKKLRNYCRGRTCPKPRSVKVYRWF